MSRRWGAFRNQAIPQDFLSEAIRQRQQMSPSSGENNRGLYLCFERALPERKKCVQKPLKRKKEKKIKNRVTTSNGLRGGGEKVLKDGGRMNNSCAGGKHCGRSSLGVRQTFGLLFQQRTVVRATTVRPGGLSGRNNV